MTERNWVPGSSATDIDKLIEGSCPHCGAAAVSGRHIAEAALGKLRQTICPTCKRVIDLTDMPRA